MTKSSSKLSSPTWGEGRLRGYVLEQRENNKVSSRGCSIKGKRKRPSEDEGIVKDESGTEEGINGKSLEELCKHLCPKQVSVVIERIRFKEIFITMPSKGVREVFYYSVASDSEEDDNDEEEEDSGDCTLSASKRGKVRVEDWRLQTIQAYSSSSSAGSNLLKLKDEETDISNHDNVYGKGEDEASSFLIEFPSSQNFIFKVGSAKDDLHTILDILGKGPMSSNIIDGYLTYRLEKYFKDFNESLSKRQAKNLEEPTYQFRHEKKTEDNVNVKPINFQYLSVNFMPVKDRDQPVSTFIPNMKYLPDLSKLGEDSDAQLIAPLYASKHLYLAVFNFQEKCVNAYDSSWHYLPMHLREGQIQAILRAITINHSHPSNNDNDQKHRKNSNNNHNYNQILKTSDKDVTSSSSLSSVPNWQVNFVTTSCPQYDEYSCGIYTIYYAENVLRGVAHHKNRWKLSNKRVMQIRRHIVKELLSTTSLGRRFLQAITD